MKLAVVSHCSVHYAPESHWYKSLLAAAHDHAGHFSAGGAALGVQLAAGEAVGLGPFTWVIHGRFIKQTIWYT